MEHLLYNGTLASLLVAFCCPICSLHQRTCLVYPGWPAGRFALSILQGNHNKRRERKAAKDGGDAEGDEDEETTPVISDVEALPTAN